MNTKTKIVENGDTKICIYTFFDEGKSFTGKAKLHPEDAEFFSPKRGLLLAEVRAQAKRFKFKANRAKEEVERIERQLAENVMKLERLLDKQSEYLKKEDIILKGQASFIKTLKKVRAL